MRISDWSSDVCSSDLAQVLVVGVGELTRRDVGPVAFQLLAQRLRLAGAGQQPLDQREALGVALRFIGRQRLAGGRRGVPILVDRKSVESGTSVSVRVELGDCRTISNEN